MTPLNLELAKNGLAENIFPQTPNGAMDFVNETVADSEIWVDPAIAGQKALPREQLAWIYRSGGAPPSAASMSGIARLLQDADIFDLNVATAPGGMLVLPWGVEILERFRGLILNLAKAASYQRHEFPYIGRRSVYENSSDLVNLKDSLVATLVDSRNDEFVLCPTGEQTIYSYWSRRLRASSDFPARIVQRACYFRPATRHKLSGGGIYKSVEANDVFEFHSAHETPTGAIADAHGLVAAFQSAAALIDAKLLWGTRPPWSNNGKLYKWAISADAPLPIGQTVQVASSYFQGQTFSERYRVGIAYEKGFKAAWHADGAISRRIVLAALHQRTGWGGWSLPLALAPFEVVVVGATDHTNSAELFQITEQAKKAGLRLKVDLASSDNVARRRNFWERRGVPLQLLLFGSAEKVKSVLRRSIDGMEYDISAFDNKYQMLELALADIRSVSASSAKIWASATVVDAPSLNSLQECLASGQVARCHLMPTRRCIEELDRISGGEVLSIHRRDEMGSCVLSGTQTPVEVYISRRI